jgi:hypothetical protein
LTTFLRFLSLVVAHFLGGLLSIVLQTPTIMPRGSGGRIRPHERDTNYDAASIIGADIEVLEEHSSTSVRNTEVQHVSE